jgi:hypothetical protein
LEEFGTFVGGEGNFVEFLHGGFVVR